jgi:hypothetical protein
MTYHMNQRMTDADRIIEARERQDARTRIDRTVEDAYDALVAALRYHRYQAEAFAEYGTEDADDQDSRRHEATAARIVRAIAELTDDRRLASQDDVDAIRYAQRRVSGD